MIARRQDRKNRPLLHGKHLASVLKALIWAAAFVITFLTAFLTVAVIGLDKVSPHDVPLVIHWLMQAWGGVSWRG